MILDEKILSKYNIKIIDGKRYYFYDVTTKLPVLQNCTPYCFKYRDIVVYNSSRNKLTIEILYELDKRNHKTNEELLALKYDFSKTEVFSLVKRTNYSKFRNIYLNTNHTSVHSLMSIQLLLKTYGVELKEVEFLIKRHFIAEPDEVRTYIRNNTISKFCKTLAFRGKTKDKCDRIINNFNIINKYLLKFSQGYDDFFLFDDYYLFYNYKIKVLEYISTKVWKDDKTYRVAKKCLDYLDDYYKYWNIYEFLFEFKNINRLKELLKTETENLFRILNTNTITISKLYSRVSLLYENEFGTQKLRISSKEFFASICLILFRKTYYCDKTYISKEPLLNLSSELLINNYIDSLDEFTITQITNYIEKNHLKKFSNITDFIASCSDRFVLITYEKLVLKEKLNIEEDVLKAIKKEMLFVIESFGSIDSETFNGYFVFPAISNYEWSKYLLLGITRTYFGDTFEVKNLVGTYKTTSYKIVLNRK